MDNPNGTKQERDALDRLNRPALVPVIAPSDMGGVRGIDTCAAITGHHRPRKRPGPPIYRCSFKRACELSCSRKLLRLCRHFTGMSTCPFDARSGGVSRGGAAPAWMPPE